MRTKLTDQELDALLQEIQDTNEMPQDIAEDISSDNAWGWGRRRSLCRRVWATHS